MPSLSFYLNRFCQTALKHVQQVFMFITPPTQFNLWNFPLQQWCYERINNDPLHFKKDLSMVCVFVRMNRLVYYYLVKFIGRFPYQYEVCQESLSLYLIKGKTLTTIDISVMEDSLHWLCSIILISTFLFFILTKFVLFFLFSAIEVELSLPWKIGESPEECAANYSQHNIFVFTAAAAQLASFDF